MLQKEEGVVLKTARSGETSLIVTFLSRGMGKIRLMAKGVLSPKHPSRGLLETSNHVEVVFYYKENRSVYFTKEVSLLSPPFAGRDSLPHLAVRLAAMELLDLVCYPGSSDENIVDLAVEFVRTGDAADPLLLFLAFELKLLAALGAFPALSGCSRCGAGLEGGVYDASDGVGCCRRHAGDTAGADGALTLSAAVLDAIHTYAAGSLSAAAAGEVPPDTRKDLGKVVHWTYTFHVQGYSLPKSLSLI
jgi:DNA repair protein RecO (recombination protein O)